MQNCSVTLLALEPVIVQWFNLESSPSLCLQCSSDKTLVMAVAYQVHNYGSSEANNKVNYIKYKFSFGFVFQFGYMYSKSKVY